MLRILFAGTPECAVPSLNLIVKKHKLVGVLTNPPAAMGRSKTLKECPVACRLRNIIDENTLNYTPLIFDPPTINDDVRNSIKDLKPDLLVCFAYGKIFKQETLDLFPLGAINIHPSLLPRWRGCAPVPSAILACDKKTGVSIQKIALKMDSGDILASKEFVLDGSETSDSLLEFLSIEAVPLLEKVLDKIAKGSLVAKPQNKKDATYSKMIKKSDGEIFWEKSAKQIDAQIRAYTPWPKSFCFYNSRMLIIHKAFFVEDYNSGKKPGTIVGDFENSGIIVQTGSGGLVLESLQWQTKKILDWKSFLNGNKDLLGKTFD